MHCKKVPEQENSVEGRQLAVTRYGDAYVKRLMAAALVLRQWWQDDAPAAVGSNDPYLFTSVKLDKALANGLLQ